MQQNQSDLVNTINEFFGFEKDKITDAEQCGLWAARFTVNGIKYMGEVAYYGAKPILNIVGYEAKSWKGTPITDWYYNEYIKDKPIWIYRWTDQDAGDWERTQITVPTEEAAIKFCEEHGQNLYGYDIGE